jgi:mRNA-degrading endonuclease RelE of RelBE toxin-antitoxin system
MDKIAKFLYSLNKKERAMLLRIFSSIENLDIKKYDIKALKGFPGLYRLRKGKIRIVFAKKGKKGIIYDVGFRKDIY